tara:strand:+ start:10497 stop:16319 length:5823 start_codon:yes stop_codon:yes gene_type:complete
MEDKKAQRLLFVEPNPCDTDIEGVNRQITPTEDLSISVELKTITRGRSVITGNGNEGTGNITNNDNDGKSSKVIGFLEGSPVGSESGERRSLTTNYTEINTSFSVDGENDLEALGIESIDIKFDTAYTPQISIKFIDIRGQSILQQGSSSKYKMFFELPYPIFELTVKGFYGKAVTYCLHLKSWNASFNSQTGNFEIQTEFIGYTYALLTDCIIGYIRATALTRRGLILFDKYKNEKDDNGFLKYPGLITIDKFLEYVNSVGRDFGKLKEDSIEIKQINSISSLNTTLKKLNSSIVSLSKGISQEGSADLLNSNLSDIVLISDNNDNDDVTNLINKFVRNTKRDWDGEENFEGINSTIEIQELKIKTSEFEEVAIKKTNLILSDFTDLETLSTALQNSGQEYNNKELRDEICKKIIRNFLIKPKQNNTKFVLYDLSRSFKETARVFNLSKIRKKTLTDKLTNLLKKKVSEQSFKPTIKNIMDMFSVHSQIFLQTIRQVSKDAEGNPERARILKEKLTYKGMDIKDEQTIYPWPEYKAIQSIKNLNLDENGNSTEDRSFYETWIGSRLLEQDFSSVPEVEFVEELLEKLMKIAKDDEQRGFGDFGKTPHFFPVSPIDAPIDFIKIDNTEPDEEGDLGSLIRKNPYYNAIIKDNNESQLTTPYSAYRCLIMRGFNGIGLSNRVIGYNQTEIMGTLEADNLFNVIVSECKKVDKTQMINSISNLALGDPENQRSEVLRKWENGVKDGVINPSSNPNGKLLRTEIIEIDGDDTKFYRYTYLEDKNNKNNSERYRTYIPVSGGFDCKKFITTATTLNSPINTLKRNSEIKKLSSSLLFVGNEVNGGKSDVINIVAGEPARAIGSEIRPSDGSVYLKIIDSNLYNNNAVNPPYGDEPINNYLENVGEKSLITQEDLKLATYNNGDIVLGDILNKYNGRYNTLEINNIIYNAYDATKTSVILGNDDKDLITEQTHYIDKAITSAFDNPKAGDVISAFYFQKDDYFPSSVGDSNGTFLATFTSNNNTTFKDKGYKMSSGVKNLTNTYRVFESSKSDDDRINVLPENYGKQRELVPQVVKGKKNIYTPFVEFSVDNSYSNNNYHFSLFGSKFYYTQSKIGRAFLYLHCISWSGIFGNTNFSVPTGSSGGYSFTSSIFNTLDADSDSFEDNDDTITIKGIFGNTGGFIKAPRLWCAFIGGLIYRYDNQRTADVGINQSIPGLFLLKNTNKDIIDFSGSTKGNLLPWQDEESYTPKADEYLYNVYVHSTCGMGFFFDADDTTRDDDGDVSKPRSSDPRGQYPKVDEVILGLPTQARNEFKRVFLEFVNGTENESTSSFEKIQENYELFESVDSMEKIHDDLFKKIKTITKYGKEQNISANTTYISPGLNSSEAAHKFRPVIDRFKGLTKQDVIDSLTLSGASIETTRIKKAIENYSNISPISDEDFEGDKNKHVFDLTMKDTGVSSANRFITDLLGENYMIMNNRPSIFRVNDGKNELHPDIVVGGITQRTNHQPIRVSADRMELYLDSFFKRFNELAKDFQDPEVDENDKYQKKIFNSIDDDTIKLSIYRTLSSINSKWIGGDISNECANIDKIAESFKFLDSSFIDIGDTFLVNPNTVYNKIHGNYNQSFFDVAQTILTNNDFTFIALPTFINFREEDLQDTFRAYSYKESIDKRIVGPSFVCIYTGQKSTNLDLGDDSEYVDDGIYIQNDGCGNIIGEPPKIFENAGNEKSLNIPYFLVSYARNNQSFFKDIKLDQREFVETAESLEIIEDLSNSGNKRKPTFNGQNLFNVYQKRSYSAEVEMMGNAMIQPMMYFQLNNIPMFKGAYLINSVTHSITPHNMSTTFKGQRQKNAKTKLIDEAQLFMNLLGPLESAGTAETISDEIVGTSSTKLVTSNTQSTNPDTQVSTNNVTTSLVSTTGNNVASVNNNITPSSSQTSIRTNINEIII